MEITQLKNAITELNNTIEEFNRRLDDVEERSPSLKTRQWNSFSESSKEERGQKRRKRRRRREEMRWRKRRRSKKSKDSIKDLWGNFKQMIYYLHYRGLRRRKDRKRALFYSYFEEIIAKKFPKLWKEMDI